MNFETIYLDAKQNETIYHTLCWNRVRLQSMNRLGKQIFVLNVSLTVHHELIIQNTNVMPLILFIRQIFSSTCFEQQVLIFRTNSCM